MNTATMKSTHKSSTSQMMLIMTSFPQMEEARSCSKHLLEQHMIACVNIIPSALSLYSWQNELIEDQECLVIMKTLNHKIPSVKDYLEAHHSYDVPEFIAHPVSETTDTYLSWIQKEIS